MGDRLGIPEYAMALAHVASLRSEDPFRKVGAAALDRDNRVIGTAYNGLAPGFDPPPGFWDDWDDRQKFMLHAEINLCSLFKRGEARLVATTTMRAKPAKSPAKTPATMQTTDIATTEDQSRNTTCAT